MARFRPNVALLLVDDRDRLLICERAKVKDAWQLPQGGVSRGESLEEALYREVEEEIGLPQGSYKILEWRDGYSYYYPDPVRRRKKSGYEGQTQTYYLCRLKKKAPPIDVHQRPREFQDHRWVAPADFQLKWVPEFKREVYRQVFKDFFDVKL